MNGGLTRLLMLLDEAFAAQAIGDENTADFLFTEVARVGRAEVTTAVVDEQPMTAECGPRHRPTPDRRGNGVATERPSLLVAVTGDCYEYDDNT